MKYCKTISFNRVHNVFSDMLFPIQILLKEKNANGVAKARHKQQLKRYDHTTEKMSKLFTKASTILTNYLCNKFGTYIKG